MIGYESEREWEFPFVVSGSSPDFASHMRKSARVWWARWCKRNLTPGQRITVVSRPFYTTDRNYDELQFLYCNNMHVHGRTPSGLSVGFPTCWVEEIRTESWDDEWL